MEQHPITAGICLTLSMALAIVSGLAAMRSLRRADPASLLR
jgi:putative ABC transport system permease protein